MAQAPPLTAPPFQAVFGGYRMRHLSAPPSQRQGADHDTRFTCSLPAGLSTTVIQSELRGRLRYQGVTITDALEAGALAAFGTPAQRAVLAAQAG